MKTVPKVIFKNCKNCGDEFRSVLYAGSHSSEYCSTGCKLENGKMRSKKRRDAAREELLKGPRLVAM